MMLDRTSPPSPGPLRAFDFPPSTLTRLESGVALEVVQHRPEASLELVPLAGTEHGQQGAEVARVVVHDRVDHLPARRCERHQDLATIVLGP